MSIPLKSLKVKKPQMSSVPLSSCSLGNAIKDATDTIFTTSYNRFFFEGGDSVLDFCKFKVFHSVSPILFLWKNIWGPCLSLTQAGPHLPTALWPCCPFSPHHSQGFPTLLPVVQRNSPFLQPRTVIQGVSLVMSACTQGRRLGGSFKRP